jgi:hypothetical protein
LITAGLNMQNVVDLNIELAVYRKGSLSCHVDLQQGIMTWEESRQWCNNFIRSLSDEQIGETRQVLEDSGLLSAIEERAQLPGDPAGLRAEPAFPKIEKRGSSLRLSLVTGERTINLSGDFLDQTVLNLLLGQIEKLSRVPFRL